MSEIRNKTKCPIPNTHNRLLDAHRLWHQAEENYFDPDAFRTYLNSTIQTLRNLTFALQAEKTNIPEFDTWYLKWQAKMKDDSILKWLNAARVTIVHKGDLETKSVAKVKLQSYLDLNEKEISIEPNYSDREIYFYLKNQGFLNIPPKIRDDLILEIERRWIVKEIPDVEILDSLAHVFRFLYNLVADAHLQAGYSIDLCKIVDNIHKKKIAREEKIECMTQSAEFRIKRVVLKDFGERKYDSQQVSVEPCIAQHAAEKYKLRRKEVNSKFSIDDPDKFAIVLLTQAKNVLQTDGYHKHVIFLFKDNSPVGIYNIRPEDRSDKYLLWRQLAREVEKEQVNAIISINEAWVTQINTNPRTTLIEQDIRKEALLVTVVTNKGHCKTFVTKFKRKYNKIKFNATTIDRGEHNFLRPVINVWKTREIEKANKAIT